MFDIIGRRRYAYLLSGILVSIGLLAIVATLIPNGHLGLQFSIAYTGGTVWEVHFKDGTPDPTAVRAVLDDQGLTGSEVAITGSSDREYVLIRTEALTLVAPVVQQGSAAAAELASPGASGLAGSTTPSSSAAASSIAPATLQPSAPASSSASATPAASLTPAATASIEPSPSTVASTAATATASGSAAPTSGAPSPSSSPLASGAAGASPGASAGAGPVSGVPTEGQFGALATALQDKFGPIDEVRQQNSVGPVVSAELIQQTFLLVLFAALAIMAWVTYRFRDFRMGGTAILALIHDVIIVVGSFAVLGSLIGLQVDALFVTAMLTVIGYSVHDTIVVFDRVRENRSRYLGEPLPDIANFSIGQTLGRSFTTSLTVIVTLMALLLFAGEAIRPFTLALLIGVAAGTYSSILVATPLFIDWHRLDDRRKARQEARASTA